ncbi:hypothetical protein WJX73_009029 [Symbiochloris irregularis]|uniref:Uncharacterized protein n=1 Tax=Symbiochloris irregularis TaxID=706552 RepID=A0AAW1P4B1_9CHLO
MSNISKDTSSTGSASSAASSASGSPPGNVQLSTQQPFCGNWLPYDNRTSTAAADRADLKRSTQSIPVPLAAAGS